VDQAEILGQLQRRFAAPAAVAGRAEDPTARHPGIDASGLVRVELDPAGRAVDVHVHPSWPRRLGSSGLEAALVQAFSAAGLARLATWAGAGPAVSRPAHRAREGAMTAESVLRASAELAEYRLQLRDRLAAETVSRGPAGRVVVVTRGGQVVRVELHRGWLATANPGAIGRHAAEAFRMAVDAVAALPDRALHGCPDLRALLGGEGTPR
jgi:hypothetical protein